MKFIFKLLAFLVILVVVAVLGLLFYVKAALPNIAAAEELKIEYTPNASGAASISPMVSPHVWIAIRNATGQNSPVPLYRVHWAWAVSALIRR